MALPVATLAWRINFQRQSATDQRTFTVSLANTVSKPILDGLVRELRAQGYTDVRLELVVTLP